MNQSSSDPDLDSEKESETRYSDDVKNPLLDAPMQDLPKQTRLQALRGSYLLVTNAILFCLSLTLLIITTLKTSHVPRDYCVKKLSFYCKSSPFNLQR